MSGLWYYRSCRILHAGHSVHLWHCLRSVGHCTHDVMVCQLEYSRVHPRNFCGALLYSYITCAHNIPHANNLLQLYSTQVLRSSRTCRMWNCIPCINHFLSGLSGIQRSKSQKRVVSHLMPGDRHNRTI